MFLVFLFPTDICRLAVASVNDSTFQNNFRLFREDLGRKPAVFGGSLTMSDDPCRSHLPDWQKICEAAEREFEPAKLLLLVGAAEEAIFLRIQQSEQKLSAEELEAIDKATQLLRKLQVERLNFPKWKGEI
jgi:hypothetical protein